MKRLIYIVVDVGLHILFWTGLPFFVLSLGMFSSPSRVVRLFTRPVEWSAPLDGCRGSIAVPPLMDVQYRVFFDWTSPGPEGRNAGPFAELPGAALRINVLDAGGREAPAAVVERPNESILLSAARDDHRPWADGCTIRYALEGDCPKFLARKPRLRVVTWARNELILAQFGIVLTAVSAPWVVGKRLRKVVAKVRARRRMGRGITWLDKGLDEE